MEGSGWPRTIEDLEELQVKLAARAAHAETWRPADATALLVAGVFVAFTTSQRGPGATGDAAWATAVLFEEGRPVAATAVQGEAGAPYSAGHLALQRGPLLEGAVRSLDRAPDVVLVNATGRDHPRRAGLALHLGAVLDLPTVGITDRPLLATGPEPGPGRGETSALLLDGELVGFRLRSRRKARPVVVHAAWRTDPDVALVVALAAAGRARTPEPLRVARRLARIRRARDEGRLDPGLAARQEAAMGLPRVSGRRPKSG